MTGKCATCAYRVYGECRRRPAVDGWPSVLDDDWCGEYRLREMRKGGAVKTDVDVAGDDIYKVLMGIEEALDAITEVLRAFPK